jgi:hypothetical protein
MKTFNYSIHVLIAGEGKSGKRMSSLIKMKLGVNEEDSYEPSIVIGPDYVKLFGDRFNLDQVRCGKDYEKYFRISQEMQDGWVTITIKNLSKYPIVFNREGWVNESLQQQDK